MDLDALRKRATLAKKNCGMVRVTPDDLLALIDGAELDPAELSTEELWRLADRMGEELVKRGELKRSRRT